MEWIDAQTLVETSTSTTTGWPTPATYLLKNKPWDLFFMHIHTPDWMYHTFSVDLDPLTARSAERCAASYEEIELALYQSVDRCLGRIMAAAADDEHADRRHLRPRRQGPTAGLRRQRRAGAGRPAGLPSRRRTATASQVDWSQDQGRRPALRAHLRQHQGSRPRGHRRAGRGVRAGARAGHQGAATSTTTRRPASSRSPWRSSARTRASSASTATRVGDVIYRRRPALRQGARQAPAHGQDRHRRPARPVHHGRPRASSRARRSSAPSG